MGACVHCSMFTIAFSALIFNILSKLGDGIHVVLDQ